MLLVLMGKSGSGKDAITKKLGWSRVVTYTTRPRRKGEKDGVDYHFISEEEFIQMSNDRKFVECKSYTMANGKTVYYGSPKDELVDIEGDKVVILTPNGYRDYLRSVNGNHISIYIYTNRVTIMCRLQNRGDSKAEIERRMNADDADFIGCEELADKIVYNNRDDLIEDVVARVKKICEEWRKNDER